MGTGDSATVVPMARMSSVHVLGPVLEDALEHFSPAEGASSVAEPRDAPDKASGDGGYEESGNDGMEDSLEECPSPADSTVAASRCDTADDARTADGGHEERGEPGHENVVPEDYHAMANAGAATGEAVDSKEECAVENFGGGDGALNAGGVEGGDSLNGGEVGGDDDDRGHATLEAVESGREGAVGEESNAGQPAERRSEEAVEELVAEGRTGNGVHLAAVPEGASTRSPAPAPEEELGEVPEVGWTGWVQAVQSLQPKPQNLNPEHRS